MIKVVKSQFIDEAVDAEELANLLSQKTSKGKPKFRVKQQSGASAETNGGTIVKDGENLEINVHPTLVEDAYKFVINAIFGNEKNAKRELLAYGTSEKELKEALKNILGYNTVLAVKGEQKAKEFLQELKQQKPFNERGKIGASDAYQLVKKMLEELTDDEFTMVVDLFKNSTNLSQDMKASPKYKILADKPKKLFAIDDDEEDRFINSKQNAFKGIATKAGTRRKIKGKVTGAINKVKGAWNAVKGAGQFARGLLA